MDTEDLMTKDWVSFRGKPVRIEEISRPSQKVCVATSRMVAYPKVSEIEPIPLTPEILEKNGFVLSEKSSSKPYQIRENSVYISVIVYKGRLNARYHERSNKPMNAMQIDCNDGITIGMTKQKEQMMKGAVECEVISTSDNGWECIRIYKKLHKCDDKVRIIVLPKED